MIKVLLFDFSRTLLFPKNKTYEGKLNPLHAELSSNLGYHFFDHFEFNQELLDYLKELENEYDLCIFTSGMIQNAPEVRKTVDPIFKRIFSGKELGFGKKDQKAYLLIAKELGRKPVEILFIDDSPSNLEVAKSVGLKTLQFRSNKQLFTNLEKLLK